MPIAALDQLAEVLLGLGVPEEDIRRAREAGERDLVSLAARRTIFAGGERLDRRAVAERAGMSVEEAAAFWRASGFAEVPDDEPLFGDVDVEMLRRAYRLIEAGLADLPLALQVTRTMAHAAARVAQAHLDVVRGLVESADEDEIDVVARMVALAAGGALDDLEDVFGYLWRRHLAAISERALLQALGEEEDVPLTVGFADLVGFSSITQQMDDRELASVVAAFEATAGDVIGELGGRVVKMIGDEVMFSVPEVLAGAEIALRLAEVFADKEELPDVRVGLARGAVVAHQGDLYGPAPNLASRLVEAAYPGTVLVSGEVRAIVGEDPRFHLKRVRGQRLKGFPGAETWVLRRARGGGDGP